jgi:phosphatidylserine/phosphatidylglycerophosphate/cardiolipin synthase-like enzyme
VRIITDNAKAEDLGSDVDRFRQAGIPLLIDRSPFHMHHKFAVIDGETLLTGSYNWTLGAARDNVENLIVVNDPRLVSAFSRAFAALWKKLDQPPDPRGTSVFRNNPG